MKYLIVSGYFHRPNELVWAEAFHKLWLDNLRRYANPAPDKVFILASGGCKQPKQRYMFNKSYLQPTWITLDGDLGHCDDLLQGRKKNILPEGPVTWMTGAWLAYSNESDFIFLEQDCLAFHDWVARLDTEIGTKGAVFGHSKMHGAAMSIFLIRHWFIPQFIRDYLEEGPETHLNRIAETKVHRMISRDPEQYAQHTMGCDKDRPIPNDGGAFYCQKLTVTELQELEQRGLISCKNLPAPPSHGTYSNHA